MEKEGERDSIILQYLTEEGYAYTSAIYRDVLNEFSIATVRRDMKYLHSRGLVEYRELPTTSGKGSGERVFSITEEGMKSLGIQKPQIQLHQKAMQRVNGQKLRHYLMMRKVERAINQSIASSKAYTPESLNEFKDHRGDLKIKMREKTQEIPIHPDARLRIFRNTGERFTMAMEMDMGSETIEATVVKKFKAYSTFLQSDSIPSYAATAPIYLLFITSAPRIENIIPKVRQLKSSRNFLFLPIEKLDEKNLFLDPVFLDCHHTLFSLSQLLEQRECLLYFQETLQKAAQKQTRYKISSHSLYSSAPDPFFPILLHAESKSTLWSPHGYLRIYAEKEGQLQEKLFALLLDYSLGTDEEFRQKLHFAQIFLTQDQYLRRITASKCHGCMILLKNSDNMALLTPLLASFPHLLKRCRILLMENCTQEKVLHEAVWVDMRNGKGVRVLPFGG